MARYYYLCLTLMNATCLENKRGRKAQSPRVAFFISPSCRRVLSRPAINGGENPWWYHEYILLCEERDYGIATLTMILFHMGKNYDTILGVVGNIPVSNLKRSCSLQLPVLSDSGMHRGGDLNFLVRVFPPPPPTLRSFTVTVHDAQGLKNVKRLWKRISLRSLCVRKMKPYLVVESNLCNEPRWVSPIARKYGRDPEFNVHRTFTCQESLIRQDKVSLTIELHHRHKTEDNPGLSDRDRAKDIMIGTAERIKVSLMEKRRNEYHDYHVQVYTPKGKYGGILSVSVALEEPDEQEQEFTPSPYNTSWEPRIRPPRRGHPGVRNLAELLVKCFGPASGMILAGLGIAAAAA